MLTRHSNNKMAIYLFSLTFSAVGEAARFEYLSPCEKISISRDERGVAVLKELKVCQTNGLSDRAGNELSLSENLMRFATPAQIMERGGDAEFVASALNDELISKEELTHCLFIKTRTKYDENDWISRFPPPEADTQKAIREVKSLAKSARYVSGAVQCGAVASEGLGLCETLAKTITSEKDLFKYIQEMREVLLAGLERNDRAAGITRLHQDRCAHRIIKNNIGYVEIGRLAAIDKKPDIEASIIQKGAIQQKTFDIISEAEKNSLNRLYMSFMQSRLEHLRKRPAVKPSP